MGKGVLDFLKGKPKGKFLDLLKARKSTYEFTGRDLSNGDLRTILETGRWSPSFLNLQPWQFVVVKNKETIQQLLESAHYGLYDFKANNSIPPVAIALVLKKKCWMGEFGFPNRDKAGIFEAYMSLAMPAMNMMLQAQELGISSAMLNVRESVSHRLVRLEDGDQVPVIVCLGYEKPGAKVRRRERKELEEIICAEYCIQKK